MSCRYPFEAAQQLVFVAGLLFLNLTGITQNDISFVSAALGSGPAFGTQAGRRLLASDLQYINTNWNIRTASSAVSQGVAAQLLVATGQGTLTVRHLQMNRPVQNNDS